MKQRNVHIHVRLKNRFTRRYELLTINLLASRINLASWRSIFRLFFCVNIWGNVWEYFIFQFLTFQGIFIYKFSKNTCFKWTSVRYVKNIVNQIYVRFQKYSRLSYFLTSLFHHINGRAANSKTQIPAANSKSFQPSRCWIYFLKYLFKFNLCHIFLYCLTHPLPLHPFSFPTFRQFIRTYEFD